jgi:glycosyltransferase involved in cell wall biosynthesis
MTVESVAVVVPARDEEALLPGCLDALRTAVDRVEQEGVPVEVVVVLDRCGDASARAVSARPWARAMEVSVGNVGAARAAGFADVLARRPPTTLGALWLATTDADSRVPADWLARQVALAGGGADLVLGTVEVDDWTQHPPQVASQWRAAYRPGDGHPHVHGANAGLRAEAYVQVGGFAALGHGEDVALVAALAHRRVVRTGGIPVVTSARRDARAPRGFGDHLARLAVPAPVSGPAASARGRPGSS